MTKSPLAKSALAAAAIVALGVGVWLRQAAVSGAPVRVAAVRAEVMNTVVRIVAYADSESAGRVAIDAAFGRMAELEATMSATIETSEVSGINRLPAESPHRLSPEMAEVIALSLRVSKLTEGAFDITVKPLIDLYKNTRGNPTPAQLDEARSRVGYEKVQFDKDRSTLIFTCERMAIDLGAVAKGYIVDEAATVLRAHGIRHFLIDAGGDILCAGGHPDGTPWTVGIQDPHRPESAEVVRTVSIADGAVVTSGNYRRFTMVDGKKRSHILNPRTGRPADMENVVTSVTVIAPTCALADALATGITVMGREDGARLAESMEDVDIIVYDE